MYFQCWNTESFISCIIELLLKREIIFRSACSLNIITEWPKACAWKYSRQKPKRGKRSRLKVEAEKSLDSPPNSLKTLSGSNARQRKCFYKTRKSWNLVTIVSIQQKQRDREIQNDWAREILINFLKVLRINLRSWEFAT